jgi:hypothetical protein
MAGDASKRPGSNDPHDALGALLLAGMAVGGLAGFWLALQTGSGAFSAPVLLVLAGVIVGTVAGEALGVAVDARRERARRLPPIPREEPAPEQVIDLEDAARLCGYDPESTRPLGWYPDPTGAEVLRLWDGNEWTAHGWSPRDQRPARRLRSRRGARSDEIAARRLRAAGRARRAHRAA